MFGLKADIKAEPDAVENVAPGFDDFELKLGDVMRGERATLGKSLLDVQRDLRINAKYIAAIENCDLSAFDTPGFVSGYVRSYARYLGMDADTVFVQFCAESGFQPPHGLSAVNNPQPAVRAVAEKGGLAGARTLYLPEPESFWSRIEPRAIGSLLVLVLLVGGLGFGSMAILKEVQKVSLGPVEDVPGIITAIDPTQEIGEAPDEDLLAIDLPRPDLSDLTFRPQMLETPQLPARDSPIATIDPQLTRPSLPTAGQALLPSMAGLPTMAAALQLTEAGMEYGPQLPPEDLAVRAAGANAPEVEILAARPAWVRITAADGTVLLEKTMDAGERYTMPDLEEPAMLRAGNSGAVYFAVNGRTYGPAAPGAQVVKQVELTAGALTERFVYADLSKDSDLAQMITVASAETEAPVDAVAAD